MPKIYITDYDNTLAPSSTPPSKEMVNIISSILKKEKIAIVTAGRSIKGLKELLVNELNTNLLTNLYLCPKFGNTIFAWEKDWFVIYEAPNITEKELKRINRSLKILNWRKYTGKWISQHKIHDKGSVISVNCLGNDVTDEEKRKWDNGGLIRERLSKRLRELLGDDYDIFIAGRNTIDIVPKGRNKADNILKILELTKISMNNAVYIGDEFYEWGNDYPTLSLDIKVHQVKNPLETETILKSYLE
jgi:HAD superfamily hydrolase (TIGR01484 family)